MTLNILGLLTMKLLSYIILSTLLFTNCVNKKNAAIQKSIQANESIKQGFIPILNGVWVLTEYIQAIEQSKSPLKAADKLKDVVTMIIDADMHADSLKILASWNNHEGFDFMTNFELGQYPNSLKVNIVDYDNKSNFYELGYEINNKDTFLLIYHYNKTKQLLDKKGFTKVVNHQKDNDVSQGLQYMVNEKLFSGNYILLNSENSSTKVDFKNDGSIIGFPDFKSYYVFTDFLGGPEAVLDEIAFNLHENNSKSFAFKISNDTTYLYSTKGDIEAGELLQLDKIQYTLVRQ